MLTPDQIREAEAELDPPEPQPEPKPFACAWCSRWFIHVGDGIKYIEPPKDIPRNTSHGICLECRRAVVEGKYISGKEYKPL